MKQPIPFGKYYLLERVNVGGMAEVYKAKATGVEGFERMVAVKRILPSIAEDEEFITMFVDEAKIAVQLTHANIAQIFDLGKVDDSYFIALEYIHGKDLRAIFNRGRSRNERVPVAMGCYAVMKLCEGLDYAHNKRDAFGQFLNLVHRDVSPQNIIVSYDGEVKIIDFGIAKAAGKAGKTQAGILKGKFGYMSPEQVQGLEVDRRSDVFGVGICLYEMLTGERLFVAETDFATLEKVRKVDIVPPSHFNRQIPEELEQIVLKALARDREQRHQTAMQLHDELQAFMYASGNFFARRDLSLYMHRVFAEEIQKESARDKEYSDTGSNAQGRVLEDVTGLTAFDEIEPVSTVSALHASSPSMQPHKQPQMQPQRGPSGPRDRLSTPGGMMMPQQGGYGAPESHGPRPLKSTLLGLPQAAMPQGATPRVMQQAATPRVSVPPLVPRANSIPPGFAHPQQGGPIMGGAAAGDAPVRTGMEMDWDDEEMSTQIYDRPDDSQRMPAPIGGAPMSGSYPPALQGGATTPGGYAPVQQPVHQPQQAYGAPSPFAQQTQPGGYTAPVAHHYDADPIAAPRQRNPMVMAILLVLGIVVAIVVVLLLVRPKAPGIVHVTTTPSDAVVSLDGRPISGSSPFIVTDVAPATTHEVSVTKAGYRSWTTKLELQAGETMELPAVALEALESGFQLDSTPSGARVFVDGKQLAQTTPVRVTSLTPGDHQIRLEIDSFAPWESSLHVTPGSVLELPRAQLTPRSPDTMEPPPTRTPVPPQDQATTPNTPRRPRTPRPTTNPMPEPPEPRVEAPAPSVGGSGTLRVQTRPWSQVFVDGRLIGNTPQMAIQVSAGSHTLMFVNDEFGLRKTVKLSVKPGEVVTRVLTLTE